MKSSSIIKYSGRLVNDMITLSAPIFIADNHININWNQSSEFTSYFKQGDMITLLIIGHYFDCKITTFNKLEILNRRSTQQSNISDLETVSAILHIRGNGSEDLASMFDVNRLVNKQDSGLRSIFIIGSTNNELQSQSINIIEYLDQQISDYLFFVHFYEYNNNQFEESQLDWSISNQKIFTWESLTPLIESQLIVHIQYKIK